MDPTNTDNLDGYIMAILTLEAIDNKEAVAVLLTELGQMMYDFNTKQGPYQQ